jgi:hypothetical protein
MNKYYLTLLLFVSSVYAELVRITEIYPAINLYVFDYQYVVTAEQKIPHVEVGSYVNFNLKDFLKKEPWDQSLKLRNKFEIEDHIIKVNPIGVIKKQPLNLADFQTFAGYCSEDLRVASFTEIEVWDNWLDTHLAFTQSTFEKTEEIDQKSIKWVVDQYANYRSSFTHSICPIFEIGNNANIVGVMNHALKRKVLSHDHKYTFILLYP